MTPEERREKPRVRFEKPVDVHWVVPSKSGNIYEVQGESVKTQAVDLAEGGLRLNFQGPITPQSILKVIFKINKKPVDVYARVVWNNPEHCGLKFIVLDKTCCKAIRDYVDSEKN